MGLCLYIFIYLFIYLYQDALSLQRVCLEKKADLCVHDDANEVPDVQSLVQELMVNLFITTYSLTVCGKYYAELFLFL